MTNSPLYGVDDATDVLTDVGFRSWSTITPTTPLAVFDPISAQLVRYELPQSVSHRLYDGPMLSIAGRAVDLLVTPDHPLYLSLSNTTDRRLTPQFTLLPASEPLPSTFKARTVADAPFRLRRAAAGSRLNSNYCPVDDLNPVVFAQLIGFSVGDGSTRGGNSIRFHLKKQRKVAFLRHVSKELGIELVEQQHDTYVVKHPRIGEWAATHLYDANRNKRIPPSYLLAGTSIIHALLNGLLQSDGSQQGTSWSYTTTSTQVADLLPALGSVIGVPLSIERGKRAYRLWASSVRTWPHVNDPRATGASSNIVDYSGLLHSATTSTGLVMVRRNDCIALCGSGSVS